MSTSTGMSELFSDEELRPSGSMPLGEGAALLRGFASEEAEALVREVRELTAVSPFRHMITPGGHRMSVAMMNCGRTGWVTEEIGYRYDPIDPTTGRPWPAMPACFIGLAARAAAEVGFPAYVPDACLVNRYEPGARLSLHQDRDEGDRVAPIVSVSLGLPAVFLYGGLKRSDRPVRLRVESGDVVVWGGPARMVFHGVSELADGEHPLTGRCRINLTFRKVF